MEGKKRKIAYTIVLATVIIGCILSFVIAGVITKNFKKEVLTGAPDKQEVNIKNLIVVETKDGKKFWEIYAETGHYDSTSDIATLHNVFGNFYLKDDKDVVVSFKSKIGKLNQKTKDISLGEDTFIIYKDGTIITADTFSWQGKEDIITADGHVKIYKKDEYYITGDKATLSNQKTDFKLEGKTTSRIYSGKDIKG